MGSRPVVLLSLGCAGQMMDGLDRWIDGVGGRSRCDCESDCDFRSRFGWVRYDTLWPLLLRRLLLHWGHGNAVRTAGRRSLPKRKEHRTIRNRYQARLRQNEQGKKLKGKRPTRHLPHLPWQLPGGGGNCYLPGAGGANTKCGCL
ncbi:hypothetical protein LI328DRAFT_156387 [Trichoderma asperelloides]|nr:hypothetical protein LI328DRAFT_156387 [Trichoderma asperelloides]